MELRHTIIDSMRKRRRANFPSFFFPFLFTLRTKYFEQALTSLYKYKINRDQNFTLTIDFFESST